MIYLLFILLFIFVLIIFILSGKVLTVAKAYYDAEAKSAKIYSHLNQRHHYLLKRYQNEDTYELILKIKKEQDLLKRLDLEYDFPLLDEECFKYRTGLLEDVLEYEKAYEHYVMIERQNKKGARLLNLPPLVDYQAFLETH